MIKTVTSQKKVQRFLHSVKGMVLIISFSTPIPFNSYYRVLKCKVTKKHFARNSRLHYYCQKVLKKTWIMLKIWWKLTKPRLRYELLNIQILPYNLCLRGTERKIAKNVWRYVFVQLLISQQIFARFLSIFHHNFFFQMFFLNILTKLEKSQKNV